MDPATRRLLFGTDEPVEPALELTAGPLSVQLRGIRLLAAHAHGHEVWHGVAFLYRDTDWGTPEPVLDSVMHEPTPNGFRVLVSAHIPAGPGIDLRIEIEGDANGRIRYEGAAIARGDVDTNRTGLCLIHPQACAGRRVQVLHADGRHSASTFPRLIAPWPPFMSVRGIRHEFAPGAWAEARFEGDVFEFEDQRNNADASYKTYNRSNMMPRPYRLSADVPIRQSVELRLIDAPPAAEMPEALSLPGRRRGAFPLIGLAITPEDTDAPEVLRSALAQLRPDLLHLVLDRPDSVVDWPTIASLLQACGGRLRLDVDRLTDSNASSVLTGLSQGLDATHIDPESVAVFPGTPTVVAAARTAFPGSAIGSGTPYFFTQLHRSENIGPVDFLSFTTSALVHGADDESVMLGLNSLPDMMDTLAATHPHRDVRIGPSGIAARHSPLGGQPPSDGTRRVALARHDPRSTALFGAAWLVGYLAQFAGAGAAAISVLDLTGPNGILRIDQGHAKPCPAFFVLERLRGVTRVEFAGLVERGKIAVLDVHTLVGHLRILSHLGCEMDHPLSSELLAPMASDHMVMRLMDAQAWDAFERGNVPAPWRPADLRMQHLPPCAVALLEDRHPA